MITAQKILIWLSRLISLPAIIFFSLFAISEGGLEIFINQGQLRVKGILFVTFLFFAAISTGVAFWSKKLGAHLLLLSGLSLMVFIFIIATQNNSLVAIVMGAPFIVSSILLYMATIKKRSREIMKIDKKYEE
ncbi:MAG: hypothetical protein U9Q96_01070 [Patescibacteria group bacterium]|nr:hypothetical protein [Patescibacteria group bacterium]